MSGDPDRRSDGAAALDIEAGAGDGRVGDDARSAARAHGGPEPGSRGAVADTVFQSAPLLDASRIHWQYGEWAALDRLSIDAIERDPDRAKLAILVAAAKAHEGRVSDARDLLRRAKAWGAPPRLIARVMASMMHNSLGRIASALEDMDGAQRHFEQALGVVETRADPVLLARTRRVRETARMGLLPDAAKLVGEDLAAAQAEPIDYDARLKYLQSELQLIGRELSLSIAHGRVAGSRGSDPRLLENVRRRSPSRDGQDVWVLDRTQNRTGGYFVDIGAGDGIRSSNTWLLETEYDWRGLCVEPTIELFELLRESRRCKVSSTLVGSRTGAEVDVVSPARFVDEDRLGARRAAGTIRVTTVSLDHLLEANDAPREIDYLSLRSTLGAYEVLSEFPFDRWRIRLLTISHAEDSPRSLLRDLLSRVGYKIEEAPLEDWCELATG